MPSPTSFAGGRYEVKRFLGERDNPGDRMQAGTTYNESLQLVTELGMRPLMERVLSRKDILKACWR